MASRVFRYRSQYNYSYAPGISTSGANGNDGARGTAGSSIHFSNYDLDNAYYKDLALQRISNNYVLTSDSDTQLSSRGYREGDLILSSSSNCYRLVLASSNSNYEFDVEYVGHIRSSQESVLNKIFRVVIYDVTDMKLYDQNSQAVTYSSMYTSPVPVNRAAPNGATTDGPLSESASRKLGRWYKLMMYSSLTQESEHASDTYDFIMDLHGVKELSMSAFHEKSDVSKVFIDDNPGLIEFYKTLQFSSTAYPCGNSQDIITASSSSTYPTSGKLTYLFGDILPDAESYANTFFISEQFADRLHPFGNNFRIPRYASGSSYVLQNGASDIIQATVNARTTSYPFITEEKSTQSLETSTHTNRLGDSVYFSSMLKENLEPYLNDFLFRDEENNYYVASIDKTTHEVALMKTYITFDSGFVGSAFTYSVDSGQISLVPKP